MNLRNHLLHIYTKPLVRRLAYSRNVALDVVAAATYANRGFPFMVKATLNILDLVRSSIAMI